MFPLAARGVLSDEWVAPRSEPWPYRDYLVAPGVVPAVAAAVGADMVFAEVTCRDADAAAARAMGILSFWLGWTGPLNLLSCRKYFAGTLYFLAICSTVSPATTTCSFCDGTVDC